MGSTLKEIERWVRGVAPDGVAGQLTAWLGSEEQEAQRSCRREQARLVQAGTGQASGDGACLHSADAF